CCCLRSCYGNSEEYNKGRTMKIILAAIACLAWVGCARDPGKCCDAFSPNEDAGIYCTAHKDAVLRFVREARDPAERLGRLHWFEDVLKKIEPMPTSDEIHAYLATFEKDHPEFWIEYDKQHFWAGRDTNLGLQFRGELMKGGFRHAVTELEH